ncbi:MAG: rRNA maturation RNase YbeY [Gemmatimonadota bacterium]
MTQVLVNVEGFAGVDAGVLERSVRAVLDRHEVKEGEVSLTLQDDHGIQALNARYLGHDRPTDVISFALHEAGEPPLGDIYIGYEQAVRQSTELEVPLSQELVRLAVHGTLHLLGFDHPEGEDRFASEFFSLQESLVQDVDPTNGGGRGR